MVLVPSLVEREIPARVTEMCENCLRGQIELVGKVGIKANLESYLYV